MLIILCSPDKRGTPGSSWDDAVTDQGTATGGCWGLTEAETLVLIGGFWVEWLDTAAATVVVRAWLLLMELNVVARTGDTVDFEGEDKVLPLSSREYSFLTEFLETLLVLLWVTSSLWTVSSLANSDNGSFRSSTVAVLRAICWNPDFLAWSIAPILFDKTDKR